MAEQAKFLTGNMFRHITVMSLTASAGLMALFVVDLLDLFFISMLGNAALAAAVGYAGAILFFTTSFGIGMGIGAGSVLARKIGEGNQADIGHATTTSLAYGFGFGCIFALLVWLNIPGLVALLGASGETQGLAVLYLRIIVPSAPFLVVGMVASAILRSHGDANRAMYATLTAGVVNAILDPILIFGLDLELVGAALASVAARLALVTVALWPIFKIYGGLKPPTWPQWMGDLRILSAIAVPAILTQMATPIGQSFLTRSMAEFGEVAVAAMAIIGRITPVAFGITFALSGAIGPIIGQNFGAKQFDRVAQAYREGLIFALLVVVIMSALLWIMRDLIAQAFGATGDARELLFLFCGPLALFFFFNAQIFVSNAVFNNLGHPFYSTWINWGRNTIGMMTLVPLFAIWLGAPGVLIGQYASGVIFGLIAWALARKVIATGPDTAPAQSGWTARQTKLMQLFQWRR